MKAKDFISVALGMLVVARGARYGVDLTKMRGKPRTFSAAKTLEDVGGCQ